MDKRDSTVVRAKKLRTFLQHVITSQSHKPQNDDDVQRSRTLVIQQPTAVAIIIHMQIHESIFT